jgi:O-antigen ligase
VLALVAVLAASALVVVVAFQTSHTDVFHEMSPVYIVRAQLQNPDRGGGRLLPLEKLPGFFGSSPVAWTIGLGPGRYGSAWHQIPFLRKYAYSVANSDWTVISGEYGLVGLLCFLAILIRPLRLSRRRSRLRDDLPWARQIALAAPSLVLVGALGMTVATILEYQPFSYPWWALLGLLEAAFAGSALAKRTVSVVQGQNGVADGTMHEDD